jgi:hypothetical protein
MMNFEVTSTFYIPLIEVKKCPHPEWSLSSSMYSAKISLFKEMQKT